MQIKPGGRGSAALYQLAKKEVETTHVLILTYVNLKDNLSKLYKLGLIAARGSFNTG